jgi:KDO2-lipid IV(A) lauroyltransferase
VTEAGFHAGCMTARSPSLAHPRHWPAWAAVGLLRLLSPLPLGLLQGMGRWCGRLAFYLVPVRRKVTETNLRLAFPDLTETERRRLARRCYESLGMGIFEAVFAYDASPERIRKVHTIEGLEHIAAAQAAGRGVLLLSAHFHTLEVSGAISTQHFPLSCFYRDPNNPVFARAIRRKRAALARRLIPFDDLRQAVRALRAGEIVWYAPDQGKKFKDTVIAPFFGEPAVTNAATGGIARLGRALVVPWFAVRRPNGRFHVVIRPPLADFPSDDAMADAVRINQLLEEFIRAAPEQYLWQHKRYKVRGPGLPDVYAR